MRSLLILVAFGYKPKYAIHVRPYEGGYQVVSGHHRRLAAIQAGFDEIPAWVEEMDDETAFMELVKANNQGELSNLEIGIHALKAVPLSEGGRGKIGGVREYARAIGRDKDSVFSFRSAALVYLKLSVCPDSLRKKSTHLEAIGKAPESHWQQLTELLVKNNWTVKQTELAVGVIKSLDIPEIFHDWLEPEKWTQCALDDFLENGDKARTHKNLQRWIEVASASYEDLPAKRRVFNIEDNEFIGTDNLNLKDLFVAQLTELKGIPSEKKITETARQLYSMVSEKDRLYEAWEKAQASEKEQQKQEEAKKRERLAAIDKYTPVGFNRDLRNCRFEPESFDAIITDPPYLLSNDGFTVRSGKEVSVNKNFDDERGGAIEPHEWVELCSGWLRPGGVLIATCTLHLLYDLQSACTSANLIIDREQGIWYKRNSPPQLSPTLLRPDFEYIFIAFKPGERHYFGYDDYRAKYDSQPSRTFDIPQCSGQERLGEHDTQKPLELYEKLMLLYCPPDGKVLEPFAGSGTTVVAAKKLGRICTWSEQDKSFFNLANDRVENTKFHWET